jgi:hypothetical protein
MVGMVLEGGREVKRDDGLCDTRASQACAPNGRKRIHGSELNAPAAATRSPPCLLRDLMWSVPNHL